MKNKNFLQVSIFILILSISSLFFLNAEKKNIVTTQLTYQEITNEDLNDREFNNETVRFQFVRIAIDFLEFIQEF